MENQTKRTEKTASIRVLQLYVYLTAILVLVILYSALQSTNGGMLLDEVYVLINNIGK